jgi:hypothetical protein
MSFLVRPPMNEPNGSELDPLLRRFFQDAMPSPWPACPTPEEPRRVVVADKEKPAASWWELSQRFAARLALALSVLLFVGGSWALSDLFRTPPVPVQPAGDLAGNPIETINPSAHHEGVGKNYKVNESILQPKDGPSKLQIEIHEFVPPQR